MDLRRRPTDGAAAWRRRQRRLRSWYRHEQQTVAAALATFSHHSAPRSTTARARGGRETKYTAAHRMMPPPQEPGTQHFKLDDEDSVPELSGLRPDPVLDPEPPVVGERHSGVGYEILLDVRVPQLDRDLTVLPDPTVRQFFGALEVVDRVYGPETARRVQDFFGQAAKQERQHEQEDGEARSSNKMGRRGRRGRVGRRNCPKDPLPPSPLIFEVALVTRVPCSSTRRTSTWRSRGTQVGWRLLFAWQR